MELLEPASLDQTQDSWPDFRQENLRPATCKFWITSLLSVIYDQITR